MASIRRLVVDVLKPHDPTTVTVAGRLADLEGVDGVNATLVETDREVQNVLVALEGPDLDIEAIEAAVTDMGGSLHSVDEVACGDRVVRPYGGGSSGGHSHGHGHRER
jgi:hypothetical protein